MFELQDDFSYRFKVTFTPHVVGDDIFVAEATPYSLDIYGPMPPEVVSPFIKERKVMYIAMADRHISDRLVSLNASSAE